MNSNMTAIMLLPSADLIFEKEISARFGGFSAYDGTGGWIEGADANSDSYTGAIKREDHVRYDIAFIDERAARAKIKAIATSAARRLGVTWLHIEWRATQCEPINVRATDASAPSAAETRREHGERISARREANTPW